MSAAVEGFENAVPLRTRIESTAHAAAEKIAQISLLMNDWLYSRLTDFLSTAHEGKILDWPKNRRPVLLFIGCNHRFANICWREIAFSSKHFSWGFREETFGVIGHERRNAGRAIFSHQPRPRRRRRVVTGGHLEAGFEYSRGLDRVDRIHAHRPRRQSHRHQRR